MVISAQMREAQADGRHLIAFSVVDEGPGIPEDDLVRVFEPFVTGVTEETQNEQGTGLGLNIVKRFVATLGGTVTVQSQPGEGSTFSFAIPLTPVENKNSDVSVRSYESDYQLTGTALLVDDHAYSIWPLMPCYCKPWALPLIRHLPLTRRWQR